MKIKLEWTTTVVETHTATVDLDEKDSAEVQASLDRGLDMGAALQELYHGMDLGDALLAGEETDEAAYAYVDARELDSAQLIT